MRRLLRNTLTALKSPGLFPSFAVYQIKRLVGGRRGPLLRLAWGDKIGGFINFSEYSKTPGALTYVEMAVVDRLTNLIVADGARTPVIIDIGANLGVTVLYFAKNVPEAEIVAFEPGPTTFDVLKENLRRNRRTGVRVENFVVSNTQGLMEFDPSPRSRATAKISRAGEGTAHVMSVRLDDYASSSSIGHIDLLKVDVEGFELVVFQGAHDLLKKGLIDIIYYEHCPSNDAQAGFAVGAAIDHLARLGYVSHEIIDDGHLRRFDDRRGVVELVNLVAFSPSFAVRHASAVQALCAN